ncbi:MAG: SUMF1/EgtB/PvdO family nonheme iron enzyme [Flavobacteriales bacterium]|nr:SUMF1/EgtB/PvdO family nonheme iron enzyme [Flavobacteriales bacterium]
MRTSKQILVAVVAYFSLVALSDNKPEIPDLPKPFREKFVVVPAGEVTLGEERTTVPGFLLAANEVSNAEYNAFVAYARASGSAELLAIALPDTDQWLQPTTFQEPLRVWYHAHPAYANYPAVNMSHAGAEAYCHWMQDRLNAEAAAGTHYEVRLPSRMEWLRAANGDHVGGPYAWGGPYLRNAKGCNLCNFSQVGDERVERDAATGKLQVVTWTRARAPIMGAAGALADNVDITAPVNAYFPSDLGLYNMNGNVAEMLLEDGQAAGGSWLSPGFDVRNESLMPFTGPSPEVGFRVAVVVRKV